MPRYLGYRLYKGANRRVFQVMGPLYGQRDANYRWWESLFARLESQGYGKSTHDLRLYTNPRTHMTVAIHVDNIQARGSHRQTELFWGALGQRYPLKEWDVVDYDKPAVYTGYTIGEVKLGGSP